MTFSPPPDPSSPSTSVEPDVLLLSLRRKQGNWVEWGQWCQQLQKAGYNTQKIFEETGFEPTHQNLVITAAQVYQSLLSYPASEPVLTYFQQRGSDVLYELRILPQAQRVNAATLALAKNLDADAAHDLAKTLQEVTRFGQMPEEFTDAAGDMVAYHSWKAARQQTDLQERSRLIAKGLSFAESQSARQILEKLLTDFTVVKSDKAPRLPLYRPESDEELPRVIPVAGRWPLTLADFQAVPLLAETGAFRLVQQSNAGGWIAIPGWQVVLRAVDPVGILCPGQALGITMASETKDCFVLVDRADCDWQTDAYFLVAQDSPEGMPQLGFDFFTTEPTIPLLGRIVLVLRTKEILDESVGLEPWQFEE
jgi:hypothetical protein